MPAVWDKWRIRHIKCIAKPPALICLSGRITHHQNVRAGNYRPNFLRRRSPPWHYHAIRERTHQRLFLRKPRQPPLLAAPLASILSPLPRAGSASQPNNAFFSRLIIISDTSANGSAGYGGMFNTARHRGGKQTRNIRGEKSISIIYGPD